MRNKIYQGSSKDLYEGNEDYTLIMSFNDNFKLESGAMLDIVGKGAINNTISSLLMSKLDMVGIENHFIEKINMREQLVQLVDLFPVQLYISSIACGRYVTEFGMDEGYVLDHPMIDFRVKNSDLKHPVINEHQITSFNWLTNEDIKDLKAKAVRVYDFLTGLFAGVGIRLVEGKFEFGKVFDGENFIIMLADEISPDNCRLWDMDSNKKLSWDGVMDDPENAFTTYQTVLQRFNALTGDIRL